MKKKIQNPNFDISDHMIKKKDHEWWIRNSAHETNYINVELKVSNGTTYATN
jgi:hypothetical protein